MKTLFIISIVAAMLLASGATFSQSSQQHDVRVSIPNALMIRIANGTANRAVDSPMAVSFDLAGRLGGAGNAFLSGTSPLAATFEPDSIVHTCRICACSPIVQARGRSPSRSKTGAA